MMGLPAPLRRSLDTLEDELLEGRAITEGPILDEIADFFEDQHLDALPEVLAHGFVAVLPTALKSLFNDDRLKEAFSLAPAEFQEQQRDDQRDPNHQAPETLRLQFMAACVAEVLLATPDERLVAGHLRCGLLALRVATCDAVLALADDGEALIWPGVYPDHEAFEADLRSRGYWLSLHDWESLPTAEKLALWQI